MFSVRLDVLPGMCEYKEIGTSNLDTRIGVTPSNVVAVVASEHAGPANIVVGLAAVDADFRAAVLEHDAPVEAVRVGMTLALESLLNFGPVQLAKAAGQCDTQWVAPHGGLLERRHQGRVGDGTRKVHQLHTDFT